MSFDSSPEVIVEIIPEDCINASHYTNTRDCLLATALKRLYPNQRIIAAGHWFEIGNSIYQMSQVDIMKIVDSYPNAFSGGPVVTEPFTVTGVTN